MADLVVVVPSRGRPQAARELADAFRQTCTANTELMFAVDDDDDTLPQYQELAVTPSGLPGLMLERLFPRISVDVVDKPANMVRALNQAAAALVTLFAPSPYAVGFMGDDHRPRTKGWDEQYLEALWDLGTGVVYGDDLLQGRRLPTQCAMTADIIRTLGYMVPPALIHMYADNYWLALGEQARCIRYLPEVVVEHRHPVAGKAQWDEGYKRVNDPSVYAKDEAAFAEYCLTGLLGDVQKVQALRAAAVA